MTTVMRWLAVLLVFISLAGCGLKGDLYLEDPDPEAEALPPLELNEPVSEEEAELSMDSDGEEVGIDSGVLSSEPDIVDETTEQPATEAP